MKKRLIIPSYLTKIKANHISLNRNYMVFGCDTETANGEPFLLQIYDGKDYFIKYVDKNSILKNFLEYFDKIPHRPDVYFLTFFHNLDFDLVSLLYGEDLTLFKKSQFTLKRYGWDLEAFVGKRYFAYFKKKDKVIMLIDSHGFLPYSLKKIAKDLNLSVNKLDKPDGLGEKILYGKKFMDYAKADCKIEYEVGKWIVNLHEINDIRICVSLPQLAMRVFRHKFLKPTDEIILPTSDILSASIRSYHGGKNGIYADAGLYYNCSEIDINSAYPYAMKCLPSFLKGSYQKIDEYTDKYVGIYNISGEVNCPYNIFFDDEFKPVKSKFKDIWITCYELEQALLYKEVKINKIYGYIWIPESNENPFSNYVDYYYKLKQETDKKDSLYVFYKLMLNSLYGKLIQSVEIKDDTIIDEDFETYINSKGELKVKRIQKTFRAGGMFNPFIASLITGKVRAMLHNLEHKFKAIHSATDSIKTLEPVYGCSNELGGYKLELIGDCYLFRNKCYLHFDEKGELKKYALHGFQGTPFDLLNMLKNKKNEYSVNHLFKVKEALIQNKTPLKSELVVRKFDFDWNEFKIN